MKTWIVPCVALIAGLVFGTGLVVSGMIDTANVKGFLDVAGAWKPALAFVMGGAVLVALPLFYLAKRRRRALTGDVLEAPPQAVDLRLMAGAAIFGIGWGLSGVCPGPAIVWMGIAPLKIAPFIAAMMVGAALADIVRAKVSDRSAT